MNWHFNQNCELIIEDLPDKTELEHSLEILVGPDENIITYEDRTVRIAEPVVDGLYTYYLYVSANPMTVDSVKNEDPKIKEEIFSICNLRKCTLELEKQTIENFLCKKVCKRSEFQTTADILLMSLFVLENLICKAKYNEATDILNALSSCGSPCRNINSNTCNCNG